MESIPDYLESEQCEPAAKKARIKPNFDKVNRKYEGPKRTGEIGFDGISPDHLSAQENINALIFDNGGYSIKINYSHEEKAKVIPNSIVKAKSDSTRFFIGNQIDECFDCSRLFYLLPCKRGYITKWDVQKHIWDYIFSDACFPLNDYPVIMTQPLYNFRSTQHCIDEIFFEEYEVTSLHRANPTDWACMKFKEDYGTDTCIIVDSGYSFTYIIPYIAGKKYGPGVTRLDIGGKGLTNRLKDMITFRQYHVQEETYVINQVKEDACYVSKDFRKDLETTSWTSLGNKIACDYVLPDFHNIRRGYIKNADQSNEFEKGCQILRLNNERISVPELLFHPSDFHINSMGVSDCIYKTIMKCPVNHQLALAKNILLLGGCTKFPGFRERVQKDIRSMICTKWPVVVKQPDDPITYSWQGGKSLLKSRNFELNLITKEQYEEFGASAIHERFDDWSSESDDEVKSELEEIEPIMSRIQNVIKHKALEAHSDDDFEDESADQTDDSEEVAWSYLLVPK